MGKSVNRLIIIGAGPAGVSAALYAKSRGIDTTIIEKQSIGGLIRTVSKVSHYTSLLGDETGLDFAKRLENQLHAADIKIIEDEVNQIERCCDGFSLSGKNNCYHAAAVIIANGSEAKDLEIAGETSDTVSHNAYASRDQIDDKLVIVCGGSDGAAKEAIFLSNYAQKVIMVQDQTTIQMIDEFKEEITKRNNIEIYTNAKLKEIFTDGHTVTAVNILRADQEINIAEKDIKIFAFIGQKPNLKFAEKLLDLDTAGYAESVDTITGTPGLFVAGDCRSKQVRQIATAVADGCLAGIKAAQYIKSLD